MHVNEKFRDFILLFVLFEIFVFVMSCTFEAFFLYIWFSSSYERLNGQLVLSFENKQIVQWNIMSCFG